MDVKFGKVKGDFDGYGCKWLPVVVNGEDFGECYKEEGTDEWAPSSDLRARFGEDLASGHSHAGAFKAAVKREIADVMAEEYRVRFEQAMVDAETCSMEELEVAADRWDALRAGVVA